MKSAIDESITEVRDAAPPISADVCYHCGDQLRTEPILYDERSFCCAGCKIVYEILAQNDLCQYYALDRTPGHTPLAGPSHRFEYLDDPTLQSQLLNFSERGTSTVSFVIPSMHCSSCIWLLENLFKINRGILHSQVDFLKKRLTIHFRSSETSLRAVVELLAALGYEPDLHLDAGREPGIPTADRSLYYKIGIAGFCFANIMLLSFPEYLSGGAIDPSLKRIFSFLNILLGLPVILYSSEGYFRSAVGGLSKKIITIDVPIAIGIFLLFARSVLDIATNRGAGYLDSMSGLVFFLLIGRVFQNITYERLNFERSYRSYFPLAVTVKKNGVEKSVSLSRLQIGDRLILRSSELIPADSYLLAGEAHIDYSFVTGESTPVEKVLGEIIYAGGKQQGSAIEVEVMKPVSQSYLTELWNSAVTHGTEKQSLITLSNTISKYFTIGVILLASGIALYWLPINSVKALNAFTGILIIACPCALAISTPFALGAAMRIFGRNGLYLKNISVVESLSKIDTIVFDKTGTITQSAEARISFMGDPLSDHERSLIRSVVRSSSHPLSQLLYSGLNQPILNDVRNFEEIPGLGVSATVFDKRVKIGSKRFVSGKRMPDSNDKDRRTAVHVSINECYKGYFLIENSYRRGLKEVLEKLAPRYTLAMLSGDNDSERKNVSRFFPRSAELHFQRSPKDKLVYIENLCSKKKKVLMIGDGLNDAGALLKSHVGLSIAEDVSAFSPACDAILDATSFGRLPELLRYARTCLKIVVFSFSLSFLYNIGGLMYAASGNLSPLIAAILMPASSLTIVITTTAGAYGIARYRGLL